MSNTELPEDPGLVTGDIAALTPYPRVQPWRVLARDLGLADGDMVMLHANENVFGPSLRALEAVRASLPEVNLYPDGGAMALREALATKHGVTPDHIVVGNGTNEIIDLLVRTFVGPLETVVTAWPSFVPYRLITQAHAREVLITPLRNDGYDLSAMAALVDQRTKLVFIANPNNPTGTYLAKRALQAFLDRIPPSVIVVLDEAYHEYAVASDYPDGTRDFSSRARIVVLRTFSKIYGLAGLRVGYGVMNPVLVRYVDRVRQHYNVNSLAQVAALAALSDHEHVEKCRRLVREGVAELEEGLQLLGLKVVPTQANFLMLKLGIPGTPVVARLSERGILVRDLRGYDLPEAIRITVGTKSMNRTLIAVLREILSR